MRESFLRIAAIAKADFLIRFRRPGLAVLFLLLSSAAYLLLPDPSEGNTLISIAGHRAIYNSATVAVATSILASVMMALFGFYLVSDSIGRDHRTRAGQIVASTPVRNLEYLTGKLFGNALLLLALVAGFMLSAMAMQAIRHEAPIEPLVFLVHFSLTIGPLVVFLSAIALFFESTPGLGGKFGDFLYFFVWMSLTMISIVLLETGKGRESPSLGNLVDVTGFAYLISNLTKICGENISIGMGPFDPRLEPVVFRGFPITRSWVLLRIGAGIVPLVFLLGAVLFFRRFDPARSRPEGARSSRNLWFSANARLKVPAERLLSGVGWPGRGAGFVNATISDFLLTFRLSPILLVLSLVGAVLSIAVPSGALHRVVVPILFLPILLFVSDVSTREKSSGALAFVWTTPSEKSRFVPIRFLVALLVGLAFTLIPIVRFFGAKPADGLGLLIGTAFAAAAATFLGVATGNGKSFVVGFFFFWYLVMNDGGRMPGFDFAGWYGTATSSVRVAWAGVAAILLVAAEALHVARVRRSW